MSSMENLFAIGLGLGLRVVVDAASRHNVRFTGTLIGLWEGAVLHHFLDRTPRSWDPYVAFGTRLFVDLVVTTDVARLAIVLLWASVTMLLAELGPRRTWYMYLVRFVYRRYRRVRRAVKRIAFPAVRLPIPSLPPLPKTPVPSRVRFYTITTSPSQTSSTPPVPIPPPAVPLITSPTRRHVPGQYTDTSSSESSSVHNDNPTDTSPPVPSPPAADGPPDEETPVIRIFPSAMVTPPENELIEIPEDDPDRTPTTTVSALPVYAPAAHLPHIVPPSSSWEIEPAERTPVDVPPINDIPEIHTVEEPDRNKSLPRRPVSGSSIHEEPVPPGRPDYSVHQQSAAPSRPDSSIREEPPLRIIPRSSIPVVVPAESDELEYVYVPMPELHEIPDMERQRTISQRSLQVPESRAAQAPELTPVDADIPNLRNIPDLPSNSELEHSAIRRRFPSERYPRDEEQNQRFPGERYPADEERKDRFPGERYPEEEERKYRYPGERYPEDEEDQAVASSSKQPAPQLPQLPQSPTFNEYGYLIGGGWDTLETRTPPPPFKEHESYLQAVPNQPDPVFVKSPANSTTRTPSPSSLSGGTRDAIIARADLLRDQANAEKLERERLDKERQRALRENKPAYALILKEQIDQADERIRKMHERAARRYFLAHNQSQSSTRTIDVHRLRVGEAIRETEKAIRDLLGDNGRDLRVITGRGNHSVNKMPVLKVALLKHLQSIQFPARVDPANPGLIIVSIPQDDPH
ncbi:hypothetical protein NEOLEDRAFT_1180838 [Neolentinus lepideus HHB14362 ss-1]|uniref:Smr domain-containing protein n=1 Tax=Neolentinus lepideus HHB14362 ss-1 TaxID=1314782 RepID=A0A165QLX3_9AGAM|nr:hypothetical protein NEOLEDRAFT_1180838 [Neolentinus lepideus HHB14362 ss-1]